MTIEKETFIENLITQLEQVRIEGESRGSFSPEIHLEIMRLQDRYRRHLIKLIKLRYESDNARYYEGSADEEELLKAKDLKWYQAAIDEEAILKAHSKFDRKIGFRPE